MCHDRELSTLRLEGNTNKIYGHLDRMYHNNPFVQSVKSRIRLSHLFKDRPDYIFG